MITRLIQYTMFLPAVLMHELSHWVIAKLFGFEAKFLLPLSVSEALLYQNSEGSFSMPDVTEIDNRFGVRANIPENTLRPVVILYYLAPFFLLFPFALYFTTNITNYADLFVSLQFIIAATPYYKDIKSSAYQFGKILEIV
jgi:hypothetical protein